MGTQNRLLVLAAAALVTLGWWFLLFSPLSSTTDEANEEAAALEAEADALREAADDSARLAAEEDAFREQLEARQERLPIWDVDPDELDPDTLDRAGFEGSTLGRQLEELAGSTGVRLEAAEFSLPQPVDTAGDSGTPDVAQIWITVRASATTLDQLQAFLSGTLDPDRVARGLVWSDLSVDANPVGGPDGADSFTLNGTVVAWAQLAPGGVPAVEETDGDSATTDT